MSLVWQAYRLWVKTASVFPCCILDSLFAMSENISNDISYLNFYIFSVMPWNIYEIYCKLHHDHTGWFLNCIILMKQIYYNWSPTSYLGYVCRLTQSVCLWGCTYRIDPEGQVPREQGAAGNSVFDTNMEGIHTRNPTQSAMTVNILYHRGDNRGRRGAHCHACVQIRSAKYTMATITSKSTQIST